MKVILSSWNEVVLKGTHLCTGGVVFSEKAFQHSGSPTVATSVQSRGVRLSKNVVSRLLPIIAYEISRLID